jgi:NAD(P)-dependent dehydrogenase (short-subunit alcohol dehydrogenase family)
MPEPDATARAGSPVAVVTGAGDGLGRAIAEQLGRSGHDLALLELDADRGATAARELGAAGRTVRSYPTDVGDARQVDAAVDAVMTDFGRIDVLVNNAGISRIGPHTHEVTDEDWTETLAVLQSGVFHCTRRVGREMLARGRGCVVNIASIRGFSPAPGRTTYSPAKAAVMMMTKVTAAEWAGRGVRVNAVAPGFFRTSMHEVDVSRGLIDEEEYLRVIPAGRFGDPVEVGKLVVFLCSDDAAYITGACITIDGGLTLIPSG